MADLPLGAEPDPAESVKEPPRNPRRDYLSQAERRAGAGTASESPGKAEESLQARPRALPGGNWLQPVPNSRSSGGKATPRRALPVPGAQPRRPAPPAPGGEAPAPDSPRGRRDRVLSAPLKPSRPPHSPRARPCPRGARGRSPPAGSPALSPPTRPPGALRARPPLTLRPSSQTPRQPPGLRFAAAGVAGGGAGRGEAGQGPGGVPAGWPHKAETGLAAPHSTPCRAALPPPRPLLKGRAAARLLGRLGERHRK